MRECERESERERERERERGKEMEISKFYYLKKKRRTQPNL